MNIEGSPFTGPLLPASAIFRPGKSLTRTTKQRIDVMQHFGGVDNTLQKDPRFFVTAMEIPTAKSSLRNRINFSINYVEVNIEKATEFGSGNRTMKVALNIKSLAMRLGLTSEEIRLLAKGKGADTLENVIHNRAILIDSHKEIINNYELNEGNLLNTQSREYIKPGLTPHSFVKMLALAQERAAKIKENPTESTEITIKEGWFTKHRFYVIPKEEARPGEIGHHIFSNEVTVLGEGGKGTAAKIRTVAGEAFAIKYAHEGEEADLQNEATNLTVLGKETSRTQKKDLFQSTPLTKANILKVSIIETNKYGEVQKRNVSAMIVSLCAKGDLFSTLEQLKKNDPNRPSLLQNICLRLGDILSEGLVAHGDIKSENYFMDDAGLPILADMGSANLITKEKGYIPPIVKGEWTYTPEFITREEATVIDRICTQFQQKLKNGLKPAESEVNEALSLIKKTDVYATGVTMYEAYTRSPPYRSSHDLHPETVDPKNKEKTKIFIKQELIKNGCDKELAELIEHMIDQDPKTRISSEKFKKKWSVIAKRLNGSSPPATR